MTRIKQTPQGNWLHWWGKHFIKGAGLLLEAEYFSKIDQLIDLYIFLS